MPIELFNRWYVEPINKLRELPNGDGGFAAFMIALPLYERYTVAKLKLDHKPTNDEDIYAEMANDLHLTDGQRRVFWAIFRIGFMHEAMPQGGKTQWITSAEFTAFPEFVTIEGQNYIRIDPWKFTDRVLSMFIEDHRRITASDSFPLPSIFSIPK